MPAWPRLLGRAGWGAMLVLGLACSDSSGPTDPGDPAPPLPPSPFVVSNPVESHAAGGRGGQFTDVWVSLRPGTIPEAWYVTIQNPSAGSRVTAQVVNGGFDPVALAAAEGDTLDFLVDGAGGVRLGSYRKVVAKRSPPAVVRTSPPPNKRDVPLNARIVVTFSEPMDAASLPGAVTLLAGGLPVPGSVEADGGDGLRAAFAPAEPLAPLTNYRLRIGTSALDLDGDALVAAIESGFTTGAGVDPGDPPPDPEDPPPDPAPPQTGQIAFVRDGQIHLVNPDGSGLIRLSAGPNDSDPAWSPDGRRIAFTRYLGWPRADIYVMDADGSNLVARTSSGWNEMPTWSPDGTRIAFASQRDGSLNVYVMGAEEDGAGAEVMLALPGWDAYPAWSPDGSRVAFVSDWRAYDFRYDVYVVDAKMGVTTLVEEPLAPGPFFSPGTDQYQPAWSPDGGRLAFVACPEAFNPCSSSTVTVVNADGSGAVSLAETSGFARPTWSPDGRWIAFGSADGIEMVGVEGGGRGLIITNGLHPAWRP